MSWKTRCLIVFVYVLTMSSTVWSNTIYIKAGSSGGGSSWADAYGDIQDGLDDAVYDDEIWVARGTYHPTQEVGGTGDRYKTFQMVNGIGIYGGFPAMGDPAWNDRDPDTYETILSGDIGTPDDNSDNCLHVFYHPTGTNLDPNSVLDGFTITGGNAEGGGGGMYNFSFRGNLVYPTITRCVFLDNAAGSSGGGMWNQYSRPTITFCIFRNNSACASGGGMYNEESYPTILYCNFVANSTCDGYGGDGGGMYNYFSSPTLINCTFKNNKTGDGLTDSGGSGDGGKGAGICNVGSSPTLINCVFSNNWTGKGGGSDLIPCGNGGDGAGIYNGKSTLPILINCTFFNNKTGLGGGAGCDAGNGGGICNWHSDPNLYNCILWGNSGDEIYNDGISIAAVTYSDVQGGYTGTGNIDDNPKFMSPDNLQLAYNSPCIDAGNNTAVPADTADVDGDDNTTERLPLDLAVNARFADDPTTADTGVADLPDYPAVVDMGAYERYKYCSGELSQALKGDLNLNCYIDLLDFFIMAGYWLEYVGPE